jgi:hypothetical protein
MESRSSSDKNRACARAAPHGAAVLAALDPLEAQLAIAP